MVAENQVLQKWQKEINQRKVNSIFNKKKPEQHPIAIELEERRKAKSENERKTLENLFTSKEDNVIRLPEELIYRATPYRVPELPSQSKRPEEYKTSIYDITRKLVDSGHFDIIDDNLCDEPFTDLGQITYVLNNVLGQNLKVEDLTDKLIHYEINMPKRREASFVKKQDFALKFDLTPRDIIEKCKQNFSYMAADGYNIDAITTTVNAILFGGRNIFNNDMTDRFINR